MSSHFPLTYSQEQLWLADKSGGSVSCPMSMVVRMAGQADGNLMERSFREIVVRHEVLRTVIREDGGETYQEVQSATGWMLRHERVHSREELDDRLQRLRRKPFDLSKDYMLRVCLYKEEEGAHILAVVLHPIAGDSRSIDILMGELIHLYNTGRKGEPPGLPPLRLQYRDYAVWQQKYLSGDHLEKQRAYWEERLRGASPLLLPGDHVRPALQSMAVSSLSFRTDGKLCQQLYALSQEEEATLFMVLLAAFEVLLCRYSGQYDICIGTPVANRTWKGSEGMIGCFMNTLVIRADLEGNPAFTDLLLQIRGSTTGAFDHRHAPFENVADQVVKVVFAMKKMPEEDAGKMEGLSLSAYDGATTDSPYDLSLEVMETKDSFTYTISYRTEIFDRDRIERMGAHYEELLRSIVKDRKEKIDILSIIPDTEKECILKWTQGKEAAYPESSTLVSLLTEQARRTPDQPAVVYNERTITYRELDEKTNQLGRYLQKKGVKEEVITGICVERSIGMVLGIVGILKAGGAYLPIDPQWPAERIKFIQEDAGCKVVLTDQHSLPTLEGLQECALIMLDGMDHASEPIQPPDVEAVPGGLAYVIYTSGSTGKPKGALIEHRSIVNELLNYSKLFGCDVDDRHLLVANYVFDASVEQIFLPLINGGALVLTDQETLLDPFLLEEVLLGMRITHMQATPSFLKELTPGSYSGLRRVCAGGEACPLSLARAWAPYVGFFNKYGPTEAAVNVSCLPYDPRARYGSILPLGRPLPNVSMYILGGRRDLLPIGITGELYIGGPQLARGYLHRPEMTLHHFMNNPFKEGERLYRTGDMCRWRADGSIEFMGRRDDQVKIRGYRIELNEIESVLAEQPGVKDCCVLAKTDSTGDRQLTGYVVMDKHFDRNDLEQRLQQKLPEYMIPHLWVELVSMPLNRNGKVDRKRLPDPAFNAAG